MVKLVCRDYGFDCSFLVEDTELSSVIEKFGKHTEEEHGIEYSKEAIMQFILRRS
jgi:predicted small metal-binding protein